MHGVLVELALTTRGHTLLLSVGDVVVRECFVSNRSCRPEAMSITYRVKSGVKYRNLELEGPGGFYHYNSDC